MRILGVTQARFLDVFFHLYRELKGRVDIEAPALYTSDHYYFHRFCWRVDAIETNEDWSILKEWEITQAGFKHTPDPERIREFEREIGDPTLWNALVADRRIFFGRQCKVKQDYRPRFSHEQMLGVLDYALTAIDRFLKETRPDLILSFGNATFGEYLFRLFARARGIPHLELRSVKIGNRVAWHSEKFELSPHLREPYEAYRDGKTDDWMAAARDYIRRIHSCGAKYEGTIQRKRHDGIAKTLFSCARALPRIVTASWQRQRSGCAGDNHSPGILYPELYRRLREPLRRRHVERHLAGRLFTPERLPGVNYVLYPLHCEPEIALQVYARPYQNQIEVVRNLALSVPVGWKVVVKEHPRSLGVRPLKYYRKLLEIPNVALAAFDTDSSQWLQGAQAVVTLSGNIGFEAALQRIPVITLGHCPFNALPDTMLRRVTDLNRLGEQLWNLIEEYAYDERAMLAYVAALMQGSIGIDLYSVLLGKPGRHSTARQAASLEEKRQSDYGALADYTLLRAAELGIEVTPYRRTIRSA